MYVLNYLYFLIITIVGYKWLTSSGSMKYPLDRHRRMWLDGPERFWILTFSTGLLALSAPAGLDLMAVRLFVLELFCLLGLLFVCKRKTQWTSASIVYVIYLLWLAIGLTYSPAPDYGFRVILKYIYPLLIMQFASAAVRDTAVFLKAGLSARMVALVSVAFIFIPYIGLLVPGVFWYVTAEAINYISIMTFSLALFYHTHEKRKNLYYVVLFLIPCFILVFRTSIMGSLVAIMAFYFIKYRLRSLPIIAGVFISGILAVFFIPSLHEKMFMDDSVSIDQFQSGQVNMTDVNTNSRTVTWEYLEHMFYEGHEIMGSGTGAVQGYMYNHSSVFNGIKVPHSDFVQMRCDNGLIGLILYGIIVMLVFVDCFRTYHSTRNWGIKVCSLVAGASVIGVYVTLYSDNVVNYSMATLSMPFGFYGMMLGLKQNKNNI